jgi:formylglycine-generating enzyme required for sulfatase activity
MDGASAASATHAAQAVEVDLIHETLVRSRRRTDSGTLSASATAGTAASPRPGGDRVATVPHWKTLWDYVEAHADRSHWQDRLDHAFALWQARRSWRRLFGLPGWDDLSEFRRRLRLKRGSEQDRFIRFGRAVWRVRLTGAGALVLAWSLWLVPSGDRMRWAAQAWAMASLPAWALGDAQEPALESPPPPERVSFTMGCKPGRDDKLGFTCEGLAEPQAVELVAPCQMAAHLVSNLDYRRFLWRRHGFAAVLAHAGQESWDFAGSTQPVVSVNWSEAVEYAAWLSKSIANRHRDAPSAVYRLPRSAEWEYAARNRRDDWMYPWGDGPVKGQAQCADCETGIAGRTAPVDQFRQTDSGIDDIVGNVWQWTAQEANPGESGGGPSVSRVLRGGSWGDDAGTLRAAVRYQVSADYRFSYFGFRLCRSSPIEKPVTAPLNAESPRH